MRSREASKLNRRFAVASIVLMVTLAVSACGGKPKAQVDWGKLVEYRLQAESGALSSAWEKEKGGE